MKVTPIKQYSQPAFPTRSILDERPELLRLVPKRWQRNPVVIAALAATAALVSGVHAMGAEAKVTLVQAVQEPVRLEGDRAVHLVSPTEDEARRVICDEAKKAGINFDTDATTMCFDFRVTPTASAASQPTLKFKLVMDGTDKKHRVSYEYVSDTDYVQLEQKAQSEGYSLSSGKYSVVEDISRSQQNGYWKAFAAYDDAWDYNTVAVHDGKGNTDAKATQVAQEASERRARMRACEQLRAQVRDFIKWLKAEGVI